MIPASPVERCSRDYYCIAVVQGDDEETVDVCGRGLALEFCYDCIFRRV